MSLMVSPCLEFLIGLIAEDVSPLVKSDEKTNSQRCICKSVRQQQLKHVNYRQCLFNVNLRPSLRQNRQRERPLFFDAAKQSALFALDDKRLLEDGATSLS
ncbi:hypothetical protein AVEN_187214-1 [Araneus ventricosus]|uniref:Uncharacterized protein n=1 Tax=Araneus ventricosus TaxID=182803 RepID=A0A4Y1ZQ76_ARAVE|nr:hypothetical protein AVEN_187214-1 [Araneus ventricosus]